MVDQLGGFYSSSFVSTFLWNSIICGFMMEEWKDGRKKASDEELSTSKASTALTIEG